MKRLLVAPLTPASLMALLFAPMDALHGIDTPVISSPIADDVVYSPHPHFRWQRVADMKIDEVHRIQLARDEAFAEMVCDDRPEVASKFVPVKALLPSKYWWRVLRGDGEWSQAADFEVRTLEKGLTIRAGSDAETVAQVMQNADSSSPACVDFEPGEHRLTVHDCMRLATLEGTGDLIIGGLGGNILIRANRVTNPRETAIALTGGQGVNITGNEFISTLPPSKGAWITAQDTNGIRTSDNQHPSDVPLIKEDSRSKYASQATA